MASVCPTGHASGSGNHLSVYIGLVKGDYDNILEWPFRYPVTVTLLDQCTDIEKRQHLSESFIPSSTWKHFQKPCQNLSGKSGELGMLPISRGTDASDIILGGAHWEQSMGFGYPRFVSHDVLKYSSFIKDDAIFLKVSVDNSTFVAP